MKDLVVKIITLKHFDDVKTAKKFFSLLDEVGLQPEKIGSIEPLKTAFSLETAIEMWTEQSPGCYEQGQGMIGKYGSMMGKRKEPRFQFYESWWKHPNKKMLNYITFYTNQKAFAQKKEELIFLFKETIKLCDAVYGYITYREAENRQRVQGGLSNSMPGVFWCNFWGKTYVDFFGEEKIKSFPWFRIEELGDHGLIAILAENPKDLVSSDDMEQRAQAHLGKDSFGDVEEDRRRATIPILGSAAIQQKKVPQLV